MPNVLFVCTGNRDRSPTAEGRFDNWDDKWEAKSAGIDPCLGRNPLTQELIDWADLILVMEYVHAEYIHDVFNRDANVRVLDIADKYGKRDPDLIRELETKVIPILRSFPQ